MRVFNSPFLDTVTIVPLLNGIRDEWMMEYRESNEMKLSRIVMPDLRIFQINAIKA